jgi:hypothetical protein
MNLKLPFCGKKSGVLIISSPEKAVSSPFD